MLYTTGSMTALKISFNVLCYSHENFEEESYIYSWSKKTHYHTLLRLTTVNFKAMTDKIVANISSFYWYSHALISTSKSKFRKYILSQNGAQTLPNFLEIDPFEELFLNIFLWWFFLLCQHGWLQLCQD